MNDRNRMALRNAIAYEVETRFLDGEVYDKVGIKAVNVPHDRHMEYTAITDKVVETLEKLDILKEMN